MRSRSFGAVGDAAMALSIVALVAATGCPTSRSTSRCVVVAGPHSTAATVAPKQGLAFLPQLLPAAASPIAAPVPLRVQQELPVRCNGQGPDGAAYPDDPIDDLTAIVHGGATVDGQARVVCPAFPLMLVSESPAIVEPPCGPSACANKQYRSATSSLAVHLLFYDDPGRHRPEFATAEPSGSCYYRLYAMSVSWEGTAPQQ